MYYLAVDIGASSGRHILGKVENGKLTLTEIFRFENGVIEKNGSLVWDIEGLFNNVLEGIKKCKEIGIIPYSIGIDTWGVDYALLDKNENLIDVVYAYRDSRTNSVIEETEKLMPFSRLYEITGIQKCTFNTVYQLYVDKKSGKLDKAEYMLSVPDYLHYKLTGVIVNEYTDASTMAMLNAKTRSWDEEIIKTFNFPRKIFGKIVEPGTVIGELSKTIQQEVGFNCKVIVPASHDTASAVMAVPSLDETPLYISSGTWSLLGTELNSPITSSKALSFNITNEGGYNKTIRFLKNITGMWAVQNIKKELNNEYSYPELMALASSAKIDSVVDLNAPEFLAPKSMIAEVKGYCKKTNQVVPETVGEVVRVVYLSLAHIYNKTIKEMQEITGKTFTSINIVGGGSNASLCNQLTKEITGKKVYAGPTEGTAIGNILCQAISSNEIKDLKEGRKIVINSFDVKEI